MRTVPLCQSLSRPTRVVLLAALASQPGKADEPAFQQVWSHASLYQSDEGWLRSVDLSGRLQFEYAWFDADQGDYDDYVWRRFRFGFKSGLARNLVVHIEGDFDLNEPVGDWYTRLTEAYVGWKPNGAFDLKVLKHSAGFTLDGATSSKRLLTLQRNNLTNNLWFTEEYFTGVSAAGQVNGKLQYRAGVFSGDGEPEVGVSEGGIFYLASIGFDWAGTLAVDEALVRFDYVSNQAHRDSNTREFSDALSLSSQWQANRLGLRTDLGWGKGYFEQSDIWGFVVMPFYDLDERWQILARYTCLSSADDNGLRLGRYENAIVSGRGDEYTEYYLGLNLFFYGQKFKWQTGLQYTEMEDAADDGGDYRGWGLTSGIRIYW
ncbi:porin [Haliea sp. E17]|uniref:porin n=1 Tax=Haliea sp. E17 TaxID=3401576 RepID=UPI003AAEB08D